MNETLAIAETSNQSPPIRLDDVDRKIISLVQLDGRRSYASIARELDISEGTVRMRINQLTSANILRFIAVVDPIEIGYKSWAMLGITVVPGVSPYDLALELSEHSEVTYATVVASKFDLLVEVWCLDLTAIAADIRVTHVIDHDENEVGSGAVGCGVSEKGAEHEAGEE